MRACAGCALVGQSNPRSAPMTKVLVLYYSSYGHVETMANAVAEGARMGAVDAGVKRDPPAPIATVDERPDYDAIIFGSPTRFGSVTSQMRGFLDQAGGLWV